MLEFVYGLCALVAAGVGLVALRWGIAVVVQIISGIRDDRAFARLRNTGDLQARIDQLAAQYVAKRPHANLVIGVFQHGRQVVRGYGTAPPTIAERDAGRLIYEIGSVTKVLTGILLAKLQHDGVVQLDDPITKHLPADVAVPIPLQSITLRQLATHTSGLPRLPDNLDATVKDEANPYANYGPAELYQFLRQARLEHPPDQSSNYSNLGAGLLGHLLELATGASYETLVHDHIAGPLGMSDTAIAGNDEQQTRRLYGYTPTGAPTAWWNLNVLAPAGGISSTAHDMLKFLAAHFVTSTESADPLRNAMIQAQKIHWGGGLRSGPVAGLGWCIDRSMLKKQLIHWHNGGTGGFVSFIGLTKNHQVAVVLLSNSGDAMAGDDSLDWMGFRILRTATKVSLEN